MAERIYPSGKPNPQPPSAAAGNGAASTATKGQTYAARPMYRPNPQVKRRRRRSGRSCWCSCCLWLTLILIALVLVAAIAGGLFYVLYSPHPPSFTVSSLRLSKLNVSTSTDTLTSRLDVSVTARNPNKKIDFVYDDVSIAVSSNGVDLGSGSISGFLHVAKNTSILKTTISATGVALDSSSASDLKKKTSLPLQIELGTKAGVQIWNKKTKKIGIKVSCDGVTVSVPKKKGSGDAETPDFNCKVKLRIKIWMWTF